MRKMGKVSKIEVATEGTSLLVTRKGGVPTAVAYTGPYKRGWTLGRGRPVSNFVKSPPPTPPPPGLVRPHTAAVPYWASHYNIHLFLLCVTHLLILIDRYILIAISVKKPLLEI